MNKFNFTNTILPIYRKMVTDTRLIFSTYTNILTSYRMIYRTFLYLKIFVISTCLRMSTYTDFVNFLEDYNRYKFEIFRVY